MVLVTEKPHVVCVPVPAQSHIKAMLKLAKLLYYRGFRITFVNTEYNHKRFLKSGGPDYLAGLPDFKFESIPDGMEGSNTDTSQDIVTLCKIIRGTMYTPLLKLVERISPVTCIVCDGFVIAPTIVGVKLGIPVVLSWPVAASEVCQVREKGIEPVKELLRDASGAIISDPNDIVSDCVEECARNTAKSSANILIQTFEELEMDSVNHISSIIPNVYTIGPLESLLAKLPEKEHLDSIGYSLWKEEPESLKWLDSRKENSVLYVNIGSIAVLSSEKIMQFARGLANSEKDFLWIIRPDMVVGENAVLLEEFFQGIKDRGFTASWCPQEDVLKHPAIWGFLTHCGWNSTIESISAGVPMICLPFFGDQPSNCKLVCNEWDVGMEMDADLKSDDVERVVREFMDGDKGKKMKKKASEWKEKADKATSEGGSSYLNFDKLVEKIVKFETVGHSPVP